MQVEASFVPFHLVLLGHGHLGKWHAEKIDQLDEGILWGIVERNTDKHNELKAKYPQTQVVADYQQLKGRVDGVVIVTPTPEHDALLDYFWDKEIAIFCEKPLCDNHEKTKEFFQRVSKRKKPVQVGHIERFNSFWDCPKFFESASKSNFFHFQRLAPFKGRGNDVDVLWDLSIHDIDLILWLKGGLPLSLICEGKKTKTSFWDEVHIHLKYKDCDCRIESSRIYHEEKRQLFFKHGRDTTIDLMTRKIKSQDSSQKEIMYDKEDLLLKEHKSFLDVLKGGEPRVTLEDSYQASLVIDACLQSLKTGNEFFFKKESFQ